MTLDMGETELEELQERPRAHVEYDSRRAGGAESLAGPPPPLNHGSREALALQPRLAGGKSGLLAQVRAREQIAADAGNHSPRG